VDVKRYCPSKKKWKAERRLAKFDRAVKRQQHESGDRMFWRKVEMDARAGAIWAKKFAEELRRAGAKYRIREIQYGPGWANPASAVNSLTVEITFGR
jgi:hypothetical protein